MSSPVHLVHSDHTACGLSLLGALPPEITYSERLTTCPHCLAVEAEHERATLRGCS